MKRGILAKRVPLPSCNNETFAIVRGRIFANYIQ